MKNGMTFGRWLHGTAKFCRDKTREYKKLGIHDEMARRQRFYEEYTKPQLEAIFNDEARR